MLDNAADRNSEQEPGLGRQGREDAPAAGLGHGARQHVLWVWHLEDAQLNGQTHVRETLPETRARAPVPLAQRLAPHRAGKRPAGHPGGVVARGAVRHGHLGRAWPLEGCAGADRGGPLRTGRCQTDTPGSPAIGAHRRNRGARHA